MVIICEKVVIVEHHEEIKKKISEKLKNRTDIYRSKHQLGKPHTEAAKSVGTHKGAIWKSEKII